MKNFQDIPTTKFPYSLFLIRNENVLKNGSLNKLYEYCQESNAIISIERLVKGTEKALVLYAPINIGLFLTELELLEIEDYIEKGAKSHQKKASVDESIIWSYLPKNESELTLSDNFFQDFSISETQHLFWQLVLSPTKKENQFQVNYRVIVVEKDVHQRIALAKKVDAYISQTLGLKKKESVQSLTVSFDEYKKRTLIPTEVQSSIISSQTLKKLF